MHLDSALRAAFANFSTLFLLVAMLYVPLQVTRSYAFRDVVEVRALHGAIAQFPDDRRVRGVDRQRLDRYRFFGVVVAVIQVGLLPVLAGGARHALDEDRRGRLPTVTGSLAGGLRSPIVPVPSGPVLASVLIAAGVYLLGSAIARLLLEVTPDAVAWAMAGLSEGTARVAGVPFVLASVALSRKGTKGRRLGAPTQP
jgi:hypothetical protein